MPQATQPISTRAGLPDPSSIISEKVFIPAGRSITRAVVESAVRTYRILITSEMDPYDAPLRPAEFALAGVQRFAEMDDDFRGTARKATKLSIANAAVEVFQDLKNLIEALPTDAEMIARRPRISTRSSARRVREEKRNVRVRAFLYAASREDDNDFHLIIGRDPALAASMYMTFELSGLPQANSRHYARLKAARVAYKTFFGNDLPGASYQFYDPPIPVQMEGSLFFDMSHSSGGRPGPASLRPDMPTIWEVHPITSIEFEPRGALAIVEAEAQATGALDSRAVVAEFEPADDRAGLPSEASIVAEKAFTSPAGKHYRILETTETDSYDSAPGTEQDQKGVASLSE